MQASERPHNRRAFPRWKAEFDVRYGISGKVHHTRGCEIGEEGISFFSPAPPELSSQIDVAYRLEENADWTEVKALVCHIDGDSVGVEFLNLRRADRMRILEFVCANCGQPN